MHPERGGFEGGAEYSFREVHPSQPIGERAEVKELIPDIKELSKGKGSFPESLDARFEKLAQVAVDKEKRMVDNIEAGENGVMFQQEMIKNILAIEDDNPKKAEEEAKKYWVEYDKKVSLYAGRFENEEDKKKVIREFGGYKNSVLGSLATIRFFEEKGFEVRFPSPHDDRFNKCDLIFERSGEKSKKFNLAVQLKSYHSEAVNAKEGARKAESAISINKNMLNDKAQQADFGVLQAYCNKLSKATGKNYSPIFINMPVSMDVLNPKNNEPKSIDLVDRRGFFKPGQLKPSLDTIWKGYEKTLTKLNG